VHSNIGGGYVDSGLSNIALEWLIAKAEEAGLCFNDPPLIKVNPEYDMGLLRNSYSPFYWFWLPRCRKIDLNDDTQTIDPSVWKRYHDPMKKYKPKSLVKWCPKDSAIRLRPA